METDEEDLHQCGRCRATFHRLIDYLYHKKIATCLKSLNSSNKPTCEQNVSFSRGNIDARRLDVQLPNNVSTDVKSSREKFYGQSDEDVTANSAVKLNSGMSYEVESKVASDDYSAYDSGNANDMNDAYDNRCAYTNNSHYYADDNCNVNSEANYNSKSNEDGQNNNNIASNQCSVCSYMAGSHCDLTRHLRKVHRSSVNMCDNCQCTFSDKYKLKRHIDKRSCRKDEVAKDSNFCDIGKRKSELTQVRKSCRIVASSYILDGDMVSFMEIPAEFICRLCDHFCSTYEDLTQHISKHSPNRPGICKFCGHWFISKYKLRRHLMSSVHDNVSDNDIESFLQEIGNLRIAYEVQALKKMISTVTSCKHCAIKFSNRTALSNHMIAVHTEGSEKTFICRICKASFDVKSNLTEHLSKFHNAVKYTSRILSSHHCPVCIRCFNSGSSMLRHYTSLHMARQQVSISCLQQSIQDSDISDCKVQSPSQTDVYSCFVCCKLTEGTTEFREHLEWHRVWMDAFDEKLSAVQSSSLNNLKHPCNECFSISDNVESFNGSKSEKIESHSAIQTSSVGSLPVLSKDISNQIQVQDSTKNLCSTCGQSYDTFCKLYHHKTVDHNLIPVFRCIIPWCLQCFDNASDYKNHSKLHSQKAFICRVCNIHFFSYESIITHRSATRRNCCSNKTMSVESNSATDYSLTDIGSSNSSQGKLSSAKINKNKTVTKKQDQFLCETCGDSFSTGLFLRRHLATHLQKQNRKCNICGTSFNKNEHLNRHILSCHSSEIPYKCLHVGCGKSFKRKDKLVEHMKCHSGVKPYSCSLCGRKYRYREGLLYHERVHEKSLRYRCTKCSMMFVRGTELRQHVLTNHGLKLMKDLYVYNCHLCSLSFSRPERVKRHLERDHSITTAWSYRCEYCSKGFPGVRSYTTHLKRNHSNNKEFTNKIECRLTRLRKTRLSQRLVTVIETSTVPLTDRWNIAREKACGNGGSDEASTSVDVADQSNADHSSIVQGSKCTKGILDAASNTVLQETGVRSLAECLSVNTESASQLGGLSQRVEFTPIRISNCQLSNQCITVSTCSGLIIGHPSNSSINNSYRPTASSQVMVAMSDANSALNSSTNTSHQLSSSHYTSNCNTSNSFYAPNLNRWFSGLPATSTNNHTNYLQYGVSTASRSVSSGVPTFSFSQANTFMLSPDDQPTLWSKDNVRSNSAATTYGNSCSTTRAFHSGVTEYVVTPSNNSSYLNHQYSSQAQHFNPWLGNMSLFNRFDYNRRSMFDAVHLPSLSDRSMAQNFTSPSWETEGRTNGRPMEYSISNYPTYDHRHSHFDYNISSRNKSYNKTLGLRQDDYLRSRNGSTFHHMTSHVAGQFPTMHVPLSILPHPTTASVSQQQQCSTGDYQWHTVPMYNWL